MNIKTIPLSFEYISYAKKEAIVIEIINVISFILLLYFIYSFVIVDHGSIEIRNTPFNIFIQNNTVFFVFFQALGFHHAKKIRHKVTTIVDLAKVNELTSKYIDLELYRLLVVQKRPLINDDLEVMESFLAKKADNES